MPICHQTPIEVVEHWGGGVWNLLAFAMQMALVLVCGSTLASAPIVKKGISALASIPKTPAAAIALVTAVAAIACWLNWGFGLIVGVIFAKEIARKLPNVDYRLLIASAYSGFVVWHAGLSGSIPLTMATPGEALTKATNGILTEPVPVSQTILNPYNLVIVAVVIVAIVITNTLMHPKKDIVTVDPALLAEDNPTSKMNVTSDSPLTPAQRMEHSRLLSWIVAIMGFVAMCLAIACYCLFVPKYGVGGVVIGFAAHELTHTLFYYLYFLPRKMHVDTWHIFTHAVLPVWILLGGACALVSIVFSFVEMNTLPLSLMKIALLGVILLVVSWFVLLDREDKNIIKSLVSSKK